MKNTNSSNQQTHIENFSAPHTHNLRDQSLTDRTDRSDAPTKPWCVTPQTHLSDLNLNWSERDLPEKERTKHVHRLHPYLGKYIPQLVEVFLRKYFLPGQKVLDPFCGSGTTLIQANELGIDAVGLDISAFNVLLANVKAASYDLKTLRREINSALEKTHNFTQNRAIQLTLLETKLTEQYHTHQDSDYLKTWFAPQALTELMTYAQVIENGSYRYKDLLKVILSRSARSARLTTHFDLDFPKAPQLEPYWCYKHSRYCTPTTEAYKFLKRYSADTFARVAEFNRLRSSASVDVYHADSRKTVIPKVNGVITSPPYVGLINYHDQHAYAYHLLKLTEKSREEIGSAEEGTGKKAQKHYKESIVKVFENVLKSLEDDGPMIVIANDKFGLYPEIAQELGVKTEGVVKRHVNRRTGRRTGEYYESIFVWRKAGQQ